MKLVPGLSDDLLKEMRKPPVRSDDPSIIQEPHVYRMTEVRAQYGDGILAVIHELFGDGSMSAIDCNLDMERVTGSQGEARCKITLNGK